jgi:hypothetical protein
MAKKKPQIKLGGTTPAAPEPTVSTTPHVTYNADGTVTHEVGDKTFVLTKAQNEAFADMQMGKSAKLPTSVHAGLSDAYTRNRITQQVEDASKVADVQKAAADSITQQKEAEATVQNQELLNKVGEVPSLSPQEEKGSSKSLVTKQLEAAAAEHEKHPVLSTIVGGAALGAAGVVAAPIVAGMAATAAPATAATAATGLTAKIGISTLTIKGLLSTVLGGVYLYGKYSAGKQKVLEIATEATQQQKFMSSQIKIINAGGDRAEAITNFNQALQNINNLERALKAMHDNALDPYTTKSGDELAKIEGFKRNTIPLLIRDLNMAIIAPDNSKVGQAELEGFSNETS